MKNHIIKAVGAVKKEKCTQSPWKGFRKVFQLNGISSIVVGVKILLFSELIRHTLKFMVSMGPCISKWDSIRKIPGKHNGT